MSNKLEFESLTNFDASTLNAAYQAINGAGTTGPAISFKIYNSSTSLIILSYDGVNDHDFIPPGASFILDVQANADAIGDSPGHKLLKNSTIVYAKTSSNTDRLILAVYK